MFYSLAKVFPETKAGRGHWVRVGKDHRVLLQFDMTLKMQFGLPWELQCLPVSGCSSRLGPGAVAFLWWTACHDKWTQGSGLTVWTQTSVGCELHTQGSFILLLPLFRSYCVASNAPGSIVWQMRYRTKNVLPWWRKGG